MSKPSNLLTVSSNLHLSPSSFIHCDGEIHPRVDDTQQEEQEEGKHQHKGVQKHLGVRELELELEVLNMAFSEDSLVRDFDDWPAGGVEVGVVFAVTLTRDGGWCRQLLVGAALGGG